MKARPPPRNMGMCPEASSKVKGTGNNVVISGNATWQRLRQSLNWLPEQTHLYCSENTQTWYWEAIGCGSLH